MGNGAPAGATIGGIVGGIPGAILGTVAVKAFDYITTEDCWNCGTDNARVRTYCRRCGKRL